MVFDDVELCDYCTFGHCRTKGKCGDADCECTCSA